MGEKVSQVFWSQLIQGFKKHSFSFTIHNKLFNLLQYGLPNASIQALGEVVCLLFAWGLESLKSEQGIFKRGQKLAQIVQI